MFRSVVAELAGATRQASGAGGTLGAGAAAKAPADGYTLFLATIAHTIAPAIYKNLAYDFEKDFDPITVVAEVPNVLTPGRRSFPHPGASRKYLKAIRPKTGGEVSGFF